MPGIWEILILYQQLFPPQPPKKILCNYAIILSIIFTLFVRCPSESIPLSNQRGQIPLASTTLFPIPLLSFLSSFFVSFFSNFIINSQADYSAGKIPLRDYQSSEKPANVVSGKMKKKGKIHDTVAPLASFQIKIFFALFSAMFNSTPLFDGRVIADGTKQAKNAGHCDFTMHIDSR